MIDFIPVSEYAHYFDVTVLCMVLTAVWQCHTGSVLKKETVSLNAMWGVLFTLILILYMGLRPVSVYFGDTVNYAKGFYTAANSRDPFSWQWEGEWLFYNLMQSYHLFNITLIPGRRPSAFSSGDALTSNVFKSNCPVVLVAFQAAYVPRSFR